MYRTRDNRFVTLGIIEDKFWANLAKAIEREDLPSPQMGHHTREILGDLGLSNGEIESLVDEGVI